MKNDKKKGLKKIIMQVAFIASLVELIVILIVATYFNYVAMTKVYDELDENIANEALVKADRDRIERLTFKIHSCFMSLDDPVNFYKNNREEYFKLFKDIQESDEYRDAWNELEDIRKVTDSTALDILLFYPDKDIFVYVIDASAVNIKGCGDMFELDVDKFLDASDYSFKGFYSRSEVYGRLRSNGVPVYLDGDEGIYAYITSDVPTNVINSRVYTFIVQSAVIAVIFGLIIAAVIITILKKHMIVPIQNISDAADVFVAGYEERDIRKQGSHIFDNIEGGKIRELSDLTNSLRSMELEMNSYLSNLDTVTRERARINTELYVARRIQADMVPSLFPPFPDRKEFEIYATMNPAKEVGGDFYDFFFVDDDHLVIVMADVSGKGIPAALYMMGSMIMIHNRAEMGGTPADILSYVNEQLCAHTVEDMFVTVWLGIMSVSTGEVIASNAGHEYPAIMNENGEFELYKDKHGFVVGGLEGTKYKNYSFTLIKGQKLYLYTDGVTEATNSQNVLFGTGRMIEALNKYKDGSVQDILTGMQSEIDSFEGNISQFDDITQLCIVRE